MEYLWTWEGVPLSSVMIHGPLWALDSCLTVQHGYFLKHKALPSWTLFKPYSIFHSCLRFCSLSILLILFRCSLWTATLSPEAASGHSALSNHRLSTFLATPSSLLPTALGHLGLTEGPDAT